MNPLEESENGYHGTASVQGVALSICLWEVGETDMSSLGSFLELEQVDYPRYNVMLTLEINRLSEKAFRLLSKPVARTVENCQITMKPVIILDEVKLYAKKDDPATTFEFDQIRIIVGPSAAAKLLVLGCVNLTAPKRK